MILNSHKCIFVHIPKTGGTSVSSCFSRYLQKKLTVKERQASRKTWAINSKHAAALLYRKSNPELFKKYFKFSIVRNPWDLTFSLYNYLWRSEAGWPKRWRKKRSRHGFPKNDTRIACVEEVHLEWSFEEWIKSDLFSISSPAAYWCKNCHQNQLDWLLINNKSGVDFVARFENLQEDFNHVCDKINVPRLDLPHTNKGPKREHYSKYYTDETKEIVAEKYKRDIEHFNYEFKNDT